MSVDRNKGERHAASRSDFPYGQPTQLTPSDREVPEDEKRTTPQPFVNPVEVIRIVAKGWCVAGNISLIVAVASVLFAFREHDPAIVGFAFFLVIGGLVCFGLWKVLTSYLAWEARDDDLEGVAESGLPPDCCDAE